jgi:hypothetical protein
MNKPFFFIGNIIDTDLELPLKVTDGFFLKKANNLQIDLIRKRIKGYLSYDHYFEMHPYESEILLMKNGGARVTSQKDKSKWGYWILESELSIEDYKLKEVFFREKEITIDNAFLLSNSEIKILMVFSNYFDNIPATITSEVKLQEKLFLYELRSSIFFNETEIYNFPIKLCQTDINNISNLIRQIERINGIEGYVRIKKALNDLSNIFDISQKSPFRIIGLFSILESLLTIPNDNDRSINKQLQSKLYLLNNRFEEKVDFRHYFKVSPDIHFEKVIEKLYSYRSDIAHGNKIDFEKKLKELNNHIQVEKFLLELVKKCLKQALIEPLLINDLRNC